MRQIEVQWTFTPRSYQLRLYEALARGVRKAVAVWHRRAGKDVTSWQWSIWQAVQTPGTYYIFYPTYAQGKKILWDGVDDRGTKYIDYVPHALRLSEPHDTEMSIHIRTQGGKESILQVIGTDKIDSIVGTNPRGCVFSEYSIQNPKAWDLMRPVLNENLGWALFIYTPRGRNHGFKLLRNAQKNPSWYTSILTVDDTLRDSERDRLDDPYGRYMKAVVAQDAIQEDRDTGMDEDLIQQEYWCSFEGQVEGSYFGRLVNAAYLQQRITRVPWNPSLPVHTAWDIGVGDENAVWFWQHGEKDTVNIIDFMEYSGKGLPFALSEMRKAHRADWTYKYHIFPWDIETKEWATEDKRIEVAQNHLGKGVLTGKKLPVDEQIDITRRSFHRFYFDENRCSRGIDAVASYHKDKDETKDVYKLKPVHDWSSHPTSALMTLAANYIPDDQFAVWPRTAVSSFDPMQDREEMRPRNRPRSYQTDFDPYEDRQRRLD